MELLSRYWRIFACPDDGNQLSYDNTSLCCSKCGRAFPVISDNLVELLPNKPYPLLPWNAIEERYWHIYLQLSKKVLRPNSAGTGWGHLPALPVGFRTFVKKERKLAWKYFNAHRDGVICDVSGGAGSFSLQFAKEAELVLHCDLDADAISFARNQAAKRKLKNILFVRSDYLQLPFVSNIADAIVCVETLLRGLSHETRLLREIMRILKPSGRFFGDFHNKRLVRDKKIIEYDKETFRRLLLHLGLTDFNLEPIDYVPITIVLSEKSCNVLDAILRPLLPPSKYMIMGEKGHLA